MTTAFPSALCSDNVAGWPTRPARYLVFALIVTSVLAIVFAPQLKADVLYTVNGSSLSVVDTTTRTAQRLGSLGSYRIGGLAIASDGQLYGVSTLANQLVRIEIDSETHRLITTPVNTLNKAVTLSTDIACDPLDPSKGLYGVADFDPNTVLFLIDTESAQATNVANLGTGGIVGLAFDPSGQLWGIDGRFDTQEQLVRIDKTTGQVAVIAPQGLSDFPNIGGLAVGPGGSFWALNSNGTSVDLLSIDRMLGTATNLGPITGLRGDLGVFGLVAAIPEPSTIVTMLLGILGWRVSARRRL